MNIKKIKEIIAEGEGLTTEFKQRFSTHNKIAKEIIAFANTKGGLLFFGIDDDGSIYGVESEKEISELVKETAEEYCEPKIEYQIKFLELLGREIVIVEIHSSNNKPHRIQDYKNELDLNTAEVYVRVNDKSVPVGKEMIKILQAESSNSKLDKYSMGKEEQIVFNFLNENDSISVIELKQLANISERRASRTLIKLVRANLLCIHTKENGQNFFTSL
ncbi:MAG: ATP-binding protein [Bacteroidetes bacterium]|nr:ATP-binding protein [Bacteroidota bacterium]MBU1116105.1 ATP-binding protein [Bacteroidota bacterium]MBU1799471.1 ATP-binding protein [Bacteroidota bacterium]